MRAPSLALIAALALGATRAAPRAQPMPEGLRREVNLHSPAFETAAAGQVIWRSTPLQETGSEFLRLHFTDIVDQSTTDYSIVVRDYKDVAVFTFSKSQFASRRAFWTHLIRKGTAVVEVRGAQPPKGLQFTIKEYVCQKPLLPKLESIIAGDQSKDVRQYDGDAGVRVAAHPVAKLSFVDSGVSFTCTGFMITDDVLITNEHCVNSQDLCDTTVALFGYELAQDGSKRPGEEHDCVKLLQVDHDLDFALLQIEGKPGATFGHLKVVARDLVQEQPLYVVEHPFGAPKRVSRIGCKVEAPKVEGRARADTDFAHRCDTAKGSSGSPMLATDNVVVGLHHLGTTSGEWASRNRAVLMKEIVGKLTPVVGPLE